MFSTFLSSKQPLQFTEPSGGTDISKPLFASWWQFLPRSCTLALLLLFLLLLGLLWKRTYISLVVATGALKDPLSCIACLNHLCPVGIHGLKKLREHTTTWLPWCHGSAATDDWLFWMIQRLLQLLRRTRLSRKIRLFTSQIPSRSFYSSSPLCMLNPGHWYS